MASGSVHTLVKSRSTPTERVKIWDGEPSTLPIGCPTRLTLEIAKSVLTHVADGGTLADWGRQPGNVNPSTVWRWAHENEQFSNALARAREIGAHSVLDRADELMADNSRDLYDNGKVIAVNTAQVQRDYRRAGLKQWLAGKWNPIYADQAGAQVNVQVNNVIDAPSGEHRDEWVKRKQAESLKKID